MSKNHNAFTKVKLYPQTEKAVRARLKRDAIPPSFTKLVNAAILKGIKLV